ncbi:bifunctional aminoglycoside phosphotransferase/ATP-binding protein [Aureliella helgolandensis]|uniref:Zeta toxin n=1 Tax=Aureliella helgolandensis TaxID=2527968 RepID=A0A518GD59_9BACT|nr:bifunctional aminoglycoside phosphotransferase/ATP-binding protein [Aureliella helgolandensis]QDV26498.1 Zeta toxin [Aureliella helgolandensis]
MTANKTNNSISSDDLIRALSESSAYPHAAQSPVTVHETHISWVFLVGEFAYKVKKPIKTSFLDYGTLEKRHKFCEEELRLDARYSEGLYLEVVPITLVDGTPRMDGPGEPFEYAVKMSRFPENALLSQRLELGALPSTEIQQLASTVAKFHQGAFKIDSNSPWGRPDSVLRNALDNFQDLEAAVTGDELTTLQVLKAWTLEYFAEHQHEFQRRIANGFIRECHGDLHLANIVYWNGHLMPFDGIEFNEDFRWIDVLSDAAFLAMDFAARGHLELCRSFINAYLEQTGDYASLTSLRWYLVYRALVRAKVAALRADQAGQSESDRQRAREDCAQHIDLAHRFSVREEPCLWITHGFSGSGKTTQSEILVQRRDAIRVRSDVERKRYSGLERNERPDQKTQQELYCESATHATYERLRQLAIGILRAGYSVVVDATFLKRNDRQLFKSTADSEGVRFAILDCHADEQTLRQRVADRVAKNNDASDANIRVLEEQLASHDPLSERELKYICGIPSKCP